MAQHELKITDTPVLEVKNRDLVIEVRQDGQLFGRLLISKGAIEWKGANKKYRRRLRWKKFDELMFESAHRIKG